MSHSGPEKPGLQEHVKLFPVVESARYSPHFSTTSKQEPLSAQLTKPVIAGRPVLARLVVAGHQPEHVTGRPGVLLGTLAGKAGDPIGTGSPVAARVRPALVDLELAQLALVPLQTLTGEARHAVDTGRVVGAVCRQALVDVLRAVVVFVSGRAIASVLLRRVAADASVLTGLLEAQDTTLFRLG